MNEAKSSSLEAALAAREIELDALMVPRLDRYCALLWEWNEKLNLTRHLDFDTFVARDLVDTLELSKQLAQGEEVMDVGTGGGVPGMTLAILREDLDMTLCESVGKKAKALESMIGALGLPTTLFHDRAEKVLEDFRFDALTARAVGPMWKLCTWFQPHWHSIGRLLAVKGPKWPEERGEARHRGLMHNVELRCVAEYPLAGTETQSYILKLWQKGRPEPGPS